MRWIVGMIAAASLGACATTLAQAPTKDCDVCPPLVAIPGGSFLMGSPQGAAGDETPQRTVTIAPFFAGKYEVTFTEWDACVADGDCRVITDDGGWGRGNRPAIGVSWEAAHAYVAWLSEKTGKRWRLLSEAEWEYVARAGATTVYPTGDTITTAQANFDGARSGGVRRLKTMPVGSFPPNAWGLHDTHGNVLEWVEDCYTPGYDGAPADGSARTTGRCTSRVLRGGGWHNLAPALRTANRQYEPAWAPLNYIGFRVARDAH